MESLEYLSCEDKKKRNKIGFCKTFAQCFSEEGKDYILGSILDFSVVGQINDISMEQMYKLTMDDFLSVIKAVRDKVVHDGICAETQLFSRDEDSFWCSEMETCEKILSEYSYVEKNENRHYSFTTTLQFEKFKYFFVEACICFIQKYIKKRKSKG